MIGNLLYHFDRALFGLLAPFLAPIFFHHKNPIYALILMYAITPLSLLAKPLGAIVFGYLGDKVGTQRSLAITLLGMALISALMAAVPTYEQVGITAPLLLMFYRFLIGFFSAGETTGGAIMVFEHSNPSKRNLVSSFYDASGILGVLLASLCIWLFNSYHNFWRALFLSGSLIGIIGWFLRKPLKVNERQKSSFESPIKTLWDNRKVVFKIAALAGFSYGNYYLITNFMNGFLPLVSKISKAEAMGLNTALLLLDFLFLPLFGLVSLKITKEKLILISLLGIIICSAPLFYMLERATTFNAAFVRIYLMVFGVVLAAPYHAFIYEISPVKHRYLIGAFSTAIGGRLFGAPILPLGLWIYHKTHLIWAPTIPLILVGILALMSIKSDVLKTKKASIA